MMEYLAGSGSFKEALEIMNEMQEAGIKPDKAACNILVQKCSKAGKTSAVMQVLRYMKENSIVLRRPVYMEALEAFRSSGESEHLLREVNPHLALKGVEEESLDSEAAFNDPLYLMDRGIMLIFLGRRNLVALEHLLAEMLNKGLWVDSELLSAIVLANCENSRPSGALLAFDYSLEVGLKLERSAYLSFIGLLIRAKSYTMVTNVVEQMIHIGIGFGTYLLFLLIYTSWDVLDFLILL
ncbi:hypothetical protein HPP92_006079 [Vanilla planifolia]|uniref:Pentatricopeptide repeat-containing protein n=1 Tax=Vanilla planifolia TaxID=51239 RepID=A0A835RIC9_VANPL|nr:hypothetical protein HPP92_006079 [Vanilla planifolia]